MTCEMSGDMEKARRCVTRGRPKTSSDRDLRALVAGEGRRLFMERGFAGMTMDELASRCQMSKRTLYRLFPSKRDLFVVIVEDHRQSMLRLPFEDDCIDLESALRHIFRIDIDEEEHVRRMAMMRLCKEEAPGCDELRSILVENAYEVSRRYFSEWVTRQVGLGRMRAIDPDIATNIMFDMFFGGLFTHDRKIREWSSREERRRYMEECISVFVAGAGCSGPR